MKIEIKVIKSEELNAFFFVAIQDYELYVKNVKTMFSMCPFVIRDIIDNINICINFTRDGILYKIPKRLEKWTK